ncbi:MAG: hypothetical protein NZ578_11940 [Candidatus Binatia bacterium]|nr:hypothetical protein [Candidatus Binatia bacterium]
MAEHSDAYIVGRLIKQTRLLIAMDDTIPMETKLQTQAMLKEFEASVSVAETEQDREEVRGQYYFLYDQLSAYPDLEALLSAMRNFISYL